MEAEIGRIYAQIDKGKCHWIFTSEDLPEWNNDTTPAIDVTGNIPAVGDLWDNQLQQFLPPPPETLASQAAQTAEDAKASQDAADVVAARQDARLESLTQMSPAQVDAWVTTNVNTLGDAKDILRTLAIAVSILARRL